MIDPPDGNLSSSILLAAAALQWRPARRVHTREGAELGGLFDAVGAPVLLQLARGEAPGSSAWLLQRAAVPGLAAYAMTRETAAALLAGELHPDGSSLAGPRGEARRLHAVWTGEAHVAELGPVDRSRA